MYCTDSQGSTRDRCRYNRGVLEAYQGVLLPCLGSCGLCLTFFHRKPQNRKPLTLYSAFSFLESWANSCRCLPDSLCSLLMWDKSISDMSLQTDVFTNAIDHFGAEQEEIRTAAAFAAGSSDVSFCIHFFRSHVGVQVTWLLGI